MWVIIAWDSIGFPLRYHIHARIAEIINSQREQTLTTSSNYTISISISGISQPYRDKPQNVPDLLCVK